MKTSLPLILICTVLLNLESRSQATAPYTTCPEGSIAIARAGTNADVTNPYYLYTVNQVTGAMTLVAGGPFKDPADQTKNLQVNAVGLSKKDGYMYALALEGTITTQKLVRLDKKYGVTSLGYLPSPVSSSGTIGLINHAAGETDTAGNYYFTAVTINPFTPVPTLDKFFIGKVGRADTISTGGVTVTYSEISLNSADCASFVSTLHSDPDNSGLKDLAYNAGTKSFFAYATYKPAGAATFSGQVIEIRPVAGSNPLRYEVVCNPTVNSHTAETAGSLIDKYGKMTILMTDGSFGTASRNEAGMYDGGYTQISANSGLPNPLRADMGSCGQQTFPEPPVTTVSCPDANIAVLRAGANADTSNPTYIYTVNTATGTLTQLPGGYLAYPGNPSRPLHINGVGINKADGFLYGLSNDFASASAKLVRFDSKYGVQMLGSVVPPVSPTGPFAAINTAAGDMDRFNNYYFTAFTANLDPNTGLPMLDKVFIGKIPNISALNSTAVPQYFEVELADPNCTAWLNSIITDPNNSGLKDMVFSGFTQTIYAYATYKPNGSANFIGQMVEFKPIAGSSPLRYRAFCSSVLNTHIAETSGALIDKLGNFIILMTDGTLGRIQSSGSILNYNGTFVPLNNNTGLPPVIRGDLASCGEAEGAVPLTLLSFTAKSLDCKSIFNWSSENEVNVKDYELWQSFDNQTFSSMATITAKNRSGRNSYSYTLAAAGRQAYYRLKITDFDGRSYFSPIIGHNNRCIATEMAFVINPNPVANMLNMNWSGVKENNTVTVEIFDAYGKQVMKVQSPLAQGNPVTKINISQLPAGTYFIKALDKNFRKFDQSFVKR